MRTDWPLAYLAPFAACPRFLSTQRLLALSPTTTLRASHAFPDNPLHGSRAEPSAGRALEYRGRLWADPGSHVQSGPTRTRPRVPGPRPDRKSTRLNSSH